MYKKCAKWKDVEVEVRFGKRFRRCDHVDGVIACERDGDHALLTYARAKERPDPDARSVLELLKEVKKAGWVLGDVGREAFSGKRLRRVSRAVEVRKAFHQAWDAKAGDPPERVELSKGGDFLENMKSWDTWDLYAVSEWLDHPLRAQCRSQNRPSVEACLAAL